MIFRCEHVDKRYPQPDGEVVALRDLDFSVDEHDFVSIVGPSGCGKTTLLKMVAGLVQPSNGKVHFSIPEGTPLRSAMVFQDLGLFPWLTIRENVAFGLETMGVGRKERHARAEELLEKVGLGNFSRSYPHQLSGGMRQRVAILRAFLLNPQILLMDEPFGSLDSQTRLVMQEELLRIWREHRNTVLYVTHDVDEAILLGDRVLVMSGRPGSIKADIPIELPRPRRMDMREQPGFAGIRKQIWNMIEAEVRQELGMQR